MPVHDFTIYRHYATYYTYTLLNTILNLSIQLIKSYLHFLKLKSVQFTKTTFIANRTTTNVHVKHFIYFKIDSSQYVRLRENYIISRKLYLTYEKKSDCCSCLVYTFLGTICKCNCQLCYVKSGEKSSIQPYSQVETSPYVLCLTLDFIFADRDKCFCLFCEKTTNRSVSLKTKISFQQYLFEAFGVNVLAAVAFLFPSRVQ